MTDGRTMKARSYQVENTVSGMILGVWEAASEAEALDAMARSAGYLDYADARRVSPEADGDLLVTEVLT